MDKQSFQEEVKKFISRNPKRTAGALLGLLAGILILTIGFFKTLLLALTTLIGYYLGSRFSIEEDLKDLIMKIIPERFK